MDNEEVINQLSILNEKVKMLDNNVAELLKWTRFEKMIKLKEVLQKILTSDTEKLMYELTDGESSTRDIAIKCNVTHKTVGNYWQRWKVMGILESTDKYGGKRYKKICSLTELGIEVPVIKIKETVDKIETLQESQEKKDEIPEEAHLSNNHLGEGNDD